MLSSATRNVNFLVFTSDRSGNGDIRQKIPIESKTINGKEYISIANKEARILETDNKILEIN